MFFFFEISQPVGLLISIPESLGLLAFGIGLVAVAVLIRWLLGREIPAKETGKVIKKA